MSTHRVVARGHAFPDHALAALENGQPAQPVEQIKQTAVVGGDVVALDALRALGNVGQEMADLARPARVGNVDEAQPVGEPCGRDLGSGHLFAWLMAGRELRLRRGTFSSERHAWHVCSLTPLRDAGCIE